MAERIRVAREFGDIAENAEYDDAKNEQAHLEARIALLEERLRTRARDDAKEIKHRRGVDRHEGAPEDVAANKTVEYHDRRLGRGRPGGERLSNESPVGKAIIGHKKGEIVEVAAPRGKMTAQDHGHQGGVARLAGHAVIDLHSHVLPGVDDGPRTLDESLDILRAAVEDGITRIAATPHVHPRYPTAPETMEAGVAAVAGAEGPRRQREGRADHCQYQKLVLAADGVLSVEVSAAGRPGAVPASWSAIVEWICTPPPTWPSVREANVESKTPLNLYLLVVLLILHLQDKPAETGCEC